MSSVTDRPRISYPLFKRKLLRQELLFTLVCHEKAPIGVCMFYPTKIIKVKEISHKKTVKQQAKHDMVSQVQVTLFVSGGLNSRCVNSSDLAVIIN